MSKNLIVSLLSDQAVQNVMFIKQMSNEQTEHLFVSTEKMETKGIKNNVKNVCGIKKEQTIIVVEDSIKDIEKKLNEIDYSNYEKILVNITGGTKMMAIAVKGFFDDKSKAEMFYVPIRRNEIVNLRNEKTKKIDCKITLFDYLRSYGVKVANKRKLTFSEEYTIKFYEKYYSELSSKGILSSLRYSRNENSIKNIWHELKKIGFEENLKNKDIKYLTGDWFEEFVYFKIRKEKKLTDDYIKIGLTREGVQNEFDVMYLDNYELYIIECKTSILNNDKNIVSETIYKAKALLKDFGLTVKASIWTLSSKQEIKNSGMERADYFDIEIKSGEELRA
ncbi:MAG: DUF1887 family CARF protein [Fibromonadales bacterium]|nr:DUF1887 family CARF protein [Fibromonadales bacterium]